MPLPTCSGLLNQEYDLGHTIPCLAIKATASSHRQRLIDVFSEYIGVGFINPDDFLAVKLSKSSPDLFFLYFTENASDTPLQLATDLVHTMLHDGRNLHRYISSIYYLDHVSNDKRLAVPISVFDALSTDCIELVQTLSSSSKLGVLLRVHPKSQTAHVIKAFDSYHDSLELTPRASEAQYVLNVVVSGKQARWSFLPINTMLYPSPRQTSPGIPFELCRAIHKIRESLFLSHTLTQCQVPNQSHDTNANTTIRTCFSSQYFPFQRIQGDHFLRRPFVRTLCLDTSSDTYSESSDPFHPAETIPLPSSGHALDFGSSPGGWSIFLASHGFLVSGVDPGAHDFAGAVCQHHQSHPHPQQQQPQQQQQQQQQQLGPTEAIKTDAFLRDDQTWLPNPDLPCTCDNPTLQPVYNPDLFHLEHLVSSLNPSAAPESNLISPCPLAIVRAYVSQITHFPMLSTTFVSQQLFDKPFSIVVSDVNINPCAIVIDLLQLCCPNSTFSHALTKDGIQCSEPIIGELLSSSVPSVPIALNGSLLPGALLILTLKNTTGSQSGLQLVTNHTVKALDTAFDVYGVRQLLSNGNETTLFARRKAYSIESNSVSFSALQSLRRSEENAVQDAIRDLEQFLAQSK